MTGGTDFVFICFAECWLGYKFGNICSGMKIKDEILLQMIDVLVRFCSSVCYLTVYPLRNVIAVDMIS